MRKKLEKRKIGRTKERQRGKRYKRKKKNETSVRTRSYHPDTIRVSLKLRLFFLFRFEVN